MRVRFIQSWGRYRRGQEFPAWHDGSGKELIRRGVLVELPELETAMVEDGEQATKAMQEVAVVAHGETAVRDQRNKRRR